MITDGPKRNVAHPRTYTAWKTNYVPPKAQPVRPGSEDFLKIPSGGKKP